MNKTNPPTYKERKMPTWVWAFMIIGVLGYISYWIYNSQVQRLEHEQRQHKTGQLSFGIPDAFIYTELKIKTF